MSLQPHYNHILNTLKERIRQARVKAAITVNTELLFLYWEIGGIISQQEKSEGWGAKIVERLAKDLHSEFSDIKGLSARNLRYMRDFFEAYPRLVLVHEPIEPLPEQDKNKNKPILQQAVAKLDTTIKLQLLVAKLPWAHNLILLEKVKDPAERIFYAQKTIENGWSRNILDYQIESNLYNRQGKAINNFELTLPSPQSDLAAETFKNPYSLEFLGISEEVKERDLERAIIANLKKFILELGKGFAYVGNQYNLVVENDDFFLDLLFYNYHLQCFVVFDLKIKPFKPDYAGKINFYINTVDAQIKTKEHKATIGIILCKTPNKTVVEYSLRGIDKPIGVADYRLSKILPDKLKNDLPTVEELEAEIEKEFEAHKSPADKKMDRLKELIGELKQPKVKEPSGPKTAEKILTKIAIPLWNELKKALKDISKEFNKTEIMIWTDNQGHRTAKQVIAHQKEYKEFNEIRIEIQLAGFIAAGTKAFYTSKEICIQTHPYYYTIALGKFQPQPILPDKLYTQLPDKNEFNTIIEKCREAIIDDITQQVERIKAQK